MKAALGVRFAFFGAFDVLAMPFICASAGENATKRNWYP
jgi:hypothetical protein